MNSGNLINHKAWIGVTLRTLPVNIVKQECIPEGCVLPTAVAITGGGGSPHPPRTGTPQEQVPPGAGTPPGADTPLARSPSTSSLGVGLETPPARSHSTSLLGVDLETCKACWDTTPPETCCKVCWDITCNACWDTTPVNRMTDRHV